MLPTYTTYGFASAFPRPQALSGDAPSFYSQGYYAALQGMPGAWRPPASEHETSPWAWQWSRETRAQEVCDAFGTPTTPCIKRASL
jgi:hypothetical protein